jgi:hypothetical protein
MKAINKIKTIAALVFALSLFQACGSSSNNNNGQGGLIPAPTSAQYTGGIYSPQMQNLNGSLYYMAPYYTGTGWGYYTTNGLASCPIGYTYNASWGLCVLTYGTQLQCPAGWTSTGWSCIPSGFSYTCPTGYQPYWYGYNMYCVAPQNNQPNCNSMLFGTVNYCVYNYSYANYPTCFYNGYGLVCKM